MFIVQDSVRIVQDFVLRVWISGSKIWGLGLKFQGLEFEDLGSRIRFSGFGFRIYGFGSRVPGLGSYRFPPHVNSCTSSGFGSVSDVTGSFTLAHSPPSPGEHVADLRVVAASAARAYLVQEFGV